jgi:hypothetical protein
MRDHCRAGRRVGRALAEHERRNRVHPHHSADRWFELTHYLITFHDETFERIARSHRVAAIDSSFPAAISSMIDLATSG